MVEWVSFPVPEIFLERLATMRLSLACRLERVDRVENVERCFE